MHTPFTVEAMDLIDELESTMTPPQALYFETLLWHEKQKFQQLIGGPYQVTETAVRRLDKMVR